MNVTASFVQSSTLLNFRWRAMSRAKPGGRAAGWSVRGPTRSIATGARSIKSFLGECVQLLFI